MGIGRLRRKANVLGQNSKLKGTAAAPIPAVTGIAVCLLVVAVCAAGCGGGNEPTNDGPQVASLEGDRRDDGGFEFEPAVDLKLAPTKLHGDLARLLPKPALEKNSVKYGGWDAANAALSAEGAEDAAMPAVAATYRSMGYDIETGKEGKDAVATQEYPQSCALFLIKAPEAAAAQPIADKIAENLLGKGFAQIDELEWADGFKKTQQILRYSRVDSHDKVDDVYVAYVKVIGDVVVFALENEAAAKLNGPGESQISRVSESGYGSRLGGQLTFLVANRLLSP